MKRYFVLIIVVLLLVPVLLVPAFAAEVYEFEFSDGALFSDSFELIGNSGTYLYYGIVPSGLYNVSFSYSYSDLHDPLSVVLSEPFYIDFGSYSPEVEAYGQFYSGTYIIDGMSSDYVFGVFQLDDITVAVVDGVIDGISFILTPFNDASEGGFSVLVDNVSTFADTCINFVTEISKTITESPLLLLTVGFLFIGGCIGIAGRLLERR